MRCSFSHCPTRRNELSNLRLATNAVGSDVRLQRIELLVKFLDLFFEQAAHGDDRLRPAFFIHNRKMSNVFLDHDSKGVITHGLSRYRMHAGRHDLFHLCPLGVSAFQDNAQHDIAFAKNADHAVIIHYNDTADLGGSHKLDGFHNSRCPRHGQNRPADYGHRFSFLFCVGTSIQEKVQFLISSPPRKTVPLITRRLLSSVECVWSLTPPITGVTRLTTVHDRGTRISMPPITADTSSVASLPSIVASRKSSLTPPMQAEASALRNAEEVICLSTPLSIAVPEDVASIMSRLEAFELGPFTTRKTPIAITRMSTVNPSDIVGGR